MSAVVQHPRAVELVARRKLRHKVEAAVERLLAILDDLDGDPEAEPWLGVPEAAVFIPQWPRTTTADHEQDAGDEPELEDEHGDRPTWCRHSAHRRPTTISADGRRARGASSKTMREALFVVALVLALALCGAVLWLKAPQRRFLRSAIVAGVIVGRMAADAAW